MLENKVGLHVDHESSVYMVKKTKLLGTIARWVLLIHDFDYKIIHISCILHLVTYYLCRVEKGKPQKFVSNQMFRCTSHIIKFSERNFFITR